MKDSFRLSPNWKLARNGIVKVGRPLQATPLKLAHVSPPSRDDRDAHEKASAAGGRESLRRLSGELRHDRRGRNQVVSPGRLPAPSNRIGRGGLRGGRSRVDR
jgi:hypothetical protein